MKPSSRLWIAALSSIVLGSSALARAALSAPTDGHVSFQASGPAGMTIEGATPDLVLVEEGESVVITVPLANLTTGISVRDRHMKEKYLEVPRFPSATLTVARSALKIPTGGDKVEADAPSTVTIHGQTRPVTVHYDAKRDGDAVSAHGKFHVNMRDFGIDVPSYLGVTVKPDIDVAAAFRVAER
jgi:polyisoprenoid-binding protein YceI